MSVYFEEGYFMAEERDGFYISELMKRTWAAELEVLVSFDEICAKNDIQWYMGCGTLLGAVRHGGFIPWDDDIDVWMLRKDAIKLNGLPKEAFSQYGLELINSYRDSDNLNLAWRVDNGRTLMLDEQHMLQYHLCPFALGVDIFPLDYIPADPNAERLQDTLLGCANNLAHQWDDPAIMKEEKINTYVELCNVLKIDMLDTYPMKQRLMILSDKIMSLYGEGDGQFISSISEKTTDNKHKFRTEWFGKPIFLSFEGILFPAPCEPDKVLAAEYGENYMTPIRGSALHGYPFYKNQHKRLLELFRINGIECPDYLRLV